MTVILVVLLVVVAVVAGVALLEGFALLVYTKKAPEGRRRVLDFLLNGRNHPYTEESMRMSHDSVPRYAEHPFTGWSLNPDFRNIYGEKVHNSHGFRCAEEFEEMAESSESDTIRIYCAGGSTTYCVYIEENGETWPEVLGRRISDMTGRKVQVVNGGVGGFNTFQSYIRLSAYIDYLRPDLVVVYHAKNDLTPFYNGNSNDQRSFPDYGNLMRSLNFKGMSEGINPLARWSYLAKLLAVWRLRTDVMGLSYVYDHRGEPDTAGLLAARTDFSIIETMQRNMVSLCRGRGIDLVYMTQRVEDPVFTRHIQAINDRIRRLENRDHGCYVYDLDRELPYDRELLFDKMHFTAEGCVQVAEHLARFVRDADLLSPIEERVAQSL